MTDTDLAPFTQPLTEAEANQFLQNLWCLLAKQTERYTMGESTSVPEETARELLSSICYTLKFEMEAAGISPRGLLGEKLDVVLKNGQKHLAEKVKEVGTLRESVYGLAEALGNSGMMEELDYVMAFLKRYDLYFFAHQTPWDMGMPLLGPAAKSIKGISYVEMYLKELQDFILQNRLYP